ncbi:TetR/AcrR family transcriptional regulator [Orbus wheelerorum]|uniref:TetR/AcrR family transcriptional regulator n=1 Tax=Orbus wheelerorum TaxID=3074111 RepID=UPI00370D6F84
MSNKSVKKKILNSAAELFYNDGIANTGINAITEKAGVAKMSLYNNFSTKSELITSYIYQRHQEWLGLYNKRYIKTNTPIDAILAVFDAYQDHAEFAYEKGFRGCGLLNAAAEFSANSPERLAVKMHKDEVEEIIATHLSKIITNQNKIKELALMLSFLLEGAIVRAGLEGSSHKILLAKNITLNILEQDINQ